LSGLSRTETDARLDEIIDFSGIRKFIDQPVKTYSSGMFVRLAFSIATSVDPDILVIDEALSVGDGEFSRRSFDRIMSFKEQGKTILFCSHALYQIEALCNQVLWLADGQVQMMGAPGRVVSAYSDTLGGQAQTASAKTSAATVAPEITATGSASITGVELAVDGVSGKRLEAVTGRNEVSIRVRFTSDPVLPPPSVGVCFSGGDGKMITSAGTHIDRFVAERAADGSGEVTAVFPQFALLKGNYWLEIFLLCEKGIHVYDSAHRIAELEVSQPGMELGVVLLPHAWR
jgi:lipopolysaccharide transport system ATP-binding protein